MVGYKSAHGLPDERLFDSCRNVPACQRCMLPQHPEGLQLEPLMRRLAFPPRKQRFPNEGQSDHPTEEGCCNTPISWGTATDSTDSRDGHR